LWKALLSTGVQGFDQIIRLYENAGVQVCLDQGRFYGMESKLSAITSATCLPPQIGP